LDDRRCQPLVDLALATNGFAIVTASVDPEEGRTLVSLLLPEAPVDSLLPMEVEDRERLASIRSFLQRRSSRRIPKLAAPALTGPQAVQHFVEVRHAFPIVTALLVVLIGVTLAYMFQGSPPTVVGQATAPPAAQSTSVVQPPARIDEVSTLPP